ncbi:MAG: OprO/OprP family phosphate-selective porin [Rhodospirillaceae bacterium]|nr:OprO/OprP family phosphate-selective porin [Rhodospirillaceae bacterium]
MKKIFFATSALMLTLTTGTAIAAEKPADLAKQIQMLQQQLQSMQQQLDAVKANEAAQTQAIAEEVKAREEGIKKAREANLEAGGKNVFEGGAIRMIPPQNPKVTESATHRFTLSSPDNAWTIAPTGRIHFDFGGFLSQKPQLATGPGTVGSRLTAGVNARRARLGVTGKAMNDFTYTFILDAGGGGGDSQATINEARIGYTGIKNTVIEAGYGSQYFTMEESTSSNDIVFLERSTPTTVASSFNSGDPRAAAGFRTWEPNKWWFGAYLTAGVPNDAHALKNRGFGAYQRASYQIIQSDLQSLHIGAGAAQVFKAPNGGANTPTTFTLSDRPENRIDGTALISTGALGTAANPVTGAQIYSAELAGTFENFFAQGEYFHYIVDRRGKTSAKFDGGYLLASYTIGGRRSYNSASGSYGGVNPVTPFSPSTGGMGAFEIAARVSYINLTDQYASGRTAAFQPNAVNGGQQTNVTVGLNWFWNSNMLWKLNYIHGNIDKTNNVTAGGVVTPTRAGIKTDAIVGRFQVMF